MERLTLKVAIGELVYSIENWNGHIFIYSIGLFRISVLSDSVVRIYGEKDSTLVDLRPSLIVN